MTTKPPPMSPTPSTRPASDEPLSVPTKGTLDLTQGLSPEGEAAPAPINAVQRQDSVLKPKELQQLGPYELVERLATGGMAEVFLARRGGPHGFQKLVAVKRILPQFAADAEFVAMFIDEARVCAQLSHPNIVQVFDFGDTGPDLYMAMEYVQGTTVSRIIRGAKKRNLAIPLEVSLYIILSVLRGLDYAHNAVGDDGEALQIVHRDVSPGNVLVDTTGTVKLTDFGIARAAEFERRTDVGQLKGKLGYMSPEQVLGLELDPRSDLFTLGIIFAELVTLRPLFGGLKELDVLMKIRDADIKSLDAADIDADVLRILHRALAKDREERYPSAAAFAEEIERVIQRKRMQAVPSQLALFLARLTGTLMSDPKQPAVQAPPSSKLVDRPTRKESDPELTYSVERTSEDLGVELADGAPQFGPLTFAQLVELVATGQVSKNARISKGSGPFKSATAFPELEKFLGHASQRWDGHIGEFKPLARVPLIAQLLRIVADRSTGALTLIDGATRKRIFFVHGAPEFITSSMKEELLGEHLVKKGAVLRMEVDMALAMLPKFDGRLGDALVGLGMLRPIELFRAIHEQMERRFLQIFTWRRGKIAFTEGATSTEEAFPLGVETFELIVRGVREGIMAEEMDGLLRPLWEEPLELSIDSIVPRRALMLSEREDYVLRRTHGRSLKEMWATLEKRKIARAEVVRPVFLALLAGILRSKGWTRHYPEAAWEAPESPNSRRSSLPP